MCKGLNHILWGKWCCPPPYPPPPEGASVIARFTGEQAPPPPPTAEPPRPRVILSEREGSRRTESDNDRRDSSVATLPLNDAGAHGDVIWNSKVAPIRHGFAVPPSPRRG